MLQWTWGVHVSFSIVASSGYMPSSGTAGSYGNFIPSFIRDLHIVLQIWYYFHQVWKNSHFFFQKIFFTVYPLSLLLDFNYVYCRQLDSILQVTVTLFMDFKAFFFPLCISFFIISIAVTWSSLYIHSRCMNLHSWQQCKRVLLFPYTLQTLIIIQIDWLH